MAERQMGPFVLSAVNLHQSLWVSCNVIITRGLRLPNRNIPKRSCCSVSVCEAYTKRLDLLDEDGLRFEIVHQAHAATLSPKAGLLGTAKWHCRAECL